MTMIANIPRRPDGSRFGTQSDEKTVAQIRQAEGDFEDKPARFADMRNGSLMRSPDDLSDDDMTAIFWAGLTVMCVSFGSVCGALFIGYHAARWMGWL